MKGTQGIGVVELLIVIVVLAILTGITASGFQGTLDRRQAEGEAQDLWSALNRARTEAIMRDTRVTLCPVNDAGQCDADASWEDGWRMFEDPMAQGYPAEDAAWIDGRGASTVDIRPNTPVDAYVSYTSRGVPRRLTGALQMGSFRICGEAVAYRLVMTSVGRVRLEEIAECPLAAPG